MKFSETVSIAFQSVKGNKLRTLLTMLGVVVGIFSVIVIMTIITMLQTSIKNGFSQLGQNTFEIQKFPAIMRGGHHAWLKYRNRPDIKLNDYYRLKNMLKQAKYIGAQDEKGGVIVRFGDKKTNPNIHVLGITADAMKTNDWEAAYGRNLRKLHVQYSNDVCDIGQDIVDKLFPGINPVGQVIKVNDYPIKVIGVLKRKPQLFGRSRDNNVLIPITTFMNVFGKLHRSLAITVMATNDKTYNSTIEAAVGYMRTIRKVKPGEDNDFDVYSNESIMSQINNITSGVRIGALVISIIALLAAGVGIMNIMLVSVTERTREIGIRKAIGARKNSILFQFLVEAVILCLTGGFIGIILGVGIGNLAGGYLHAQMAIPFNWVAMGFALCLMVGIIFGTYPAYKAANLDPIEALRHE